MIQFANGAHSPRSIMASGGLLLVLSLGGAAFAEEENSQSESTSAALLRSLLGDSAISLPGEKPNAQDQGEQIQPEKPALPATGLADPIDAIDPEQAANYTRIVRQLRGGLDLAQNRLLDGQTDQETQSAQSSAISATEELLKMAEQAAANAPPRPRSPDGTPDANEEMEQGLGSESGNPSEETGAVENEAPAGGNMAQMPSNSASADSSERTQGPDAAQPLPPLYHESIVERTWGHLPDRMRQRLLNSRDGKPLPGYKTLVDRYFESLIQSEEGAP